MKYKLSEIRKTVIAAIPTVIAFAKVISDGLGDGTVSNQEWLAAVIAALTTLGVFAVRNERGAGQSARPGVSEADGKGTLAVIDPSVGGRSEA